MMSERMERVTRRKLCPVCGKPDWCLVASDGSAAICQRIEEGSVKRCGDAGWLHILRDDRRMPAPKCFAVRVNVRADGSKDFDQLAGLCQRQLTAGRMADLARSLGVSVESLKRLGTGWDGAAYTLPMKDAEGCVIGIRRRFLNGFKCSVRGSRSGLFIPAGLTNARRLFVTEGATDVAAALDLGLDAVGRPSCHGTIEMVAQAARGRAEIIIVGDNDDVGRRGAAKLADALVLHYRVRAVYPPAGINDLRAWLLRGLSGEAFQHAIDRAPPVDVRVESGGARL